MQQCLLVFPLNVLQGQVFTGVCVSDASLSLRECTLQWFCHRCSAVLRRTALTRALLAMEDSITMDVLFYQRDPDRGWQFKPEAPGCTPDTATGGMHFIRQLYEKFDSKEKSVSVDVLPSTLFMKLVSMHLCTSRNFVGPLGPCFCTGN